MKHYYSYCPDNLNGQTPWYLKDTDCPWCLQKKVLLHERDYRRHPEEAIIILTNHLQHSL